MSGHESSLALDAQHFTQFRDFLHDACGIFLADNKQYLVTTRITPLLSSRGIANIGELVSELTRNRYSPLREPCGAQ
jgi:chemotaxis protein methyltransferase CheR